MLASLSVPTPALMNSKSVMPSVAADAIFDVSRNTTISIIGFRVRIFTRRVYVSMTPGSFPSSITQAFACCASTVQAVLAETFMEWSTSCLKSSISVVMPRNTHPQQNMNPGRNGFFEQYLHDFKLYYYYTHPPE